MIKLLTVFVSLFSFLSLLNAQVLKVGFERKKYNTSIKELADFDEKKSANKIVPDIQSPFKTLLYHDSTYCLLSFDSERKLIEKKLAYLKSEKLYIYRYYFNENINRNDTFIVVSDFIPKDAYKEDLTNSVNQSMKIIRKNIAKRKKILGRKCSSQKITYSVFKMASGVLARKNVALVYYTDYFKLPSIKTLMKSVLELEFLLPNGELCLDIKDFNSKLNFVMHTQAIKISEVSLEAFEKYTFVPKYDDFEINKKMKSKLKEMIQFFMKKDTLQFPILPY